MNSALRTRAMPPKPGKHRHGLDNAVGKHELSCAMRDSRTKRKKLDYPEETEGSRIAAQLRKEASKLTAEQQRELFRRAMVRIYGGEPKATTVVG